MNQHLEEKLLISEIIYKDIKSDGDYRREFEDLITQSGNGDFSQKLYDADRMILTTTTRPERDQEWIERHDVLNFGKLTVIAEEMLSLSELLLVTGLATAETKMTTMDQRPDYNSDTWKFAHRFATHPAHARAEYAYLALSRLRVLGLSEQQALQLINPELNKIDKHYFS